MRCRRYLFVVLIVLSATALAVGTGADTVTYDEVDVLELQPASEDNGNAYVDENGDGEIQILVNGESNGPAGNGVNDDAIYDFGPVFTIENVFIFGDPPADRANIATVWIDHGGEAVTFYDISTGDPIEDQNHGEELSPGEATTVGMKVDTTGEMRPTITTLTVRADIDDIVFDDIEYRPDGGDVELYDEFDVTATAVAGNAELDVTEELTIEDSSETIAVDGENRVIETIDVGDGWIDVSVGDDMERIEFDIQDPASDTGSGFGSDPDSSLDTDAADDEDFDAAEEEDPNTVEEPEADESDGEVTVPDPTADTGEGPSEASGENDRDPDDTDDGIAADLIELSGVGAPSSLAVIAAAAAILSFAYAYRIRLVTDTTPKNAGRNNGTRERRGENCSRRGSGGERRRRDGGRR